MGGILTGSNTPPTFSVSFEGMWVCMSFFVCAAGAPKKKKFSGASLSEKKDSHSQFTSECR